MPFGALPQTGSLRSVIMNDFSVIGKSVLKKDAIEKVLGKATFAADIKMPNMVYCEVFRSDICSGIIKKLDTSRAEKAEGVIAILTHKNVSGINGIGIIFKDEPVLVEDKIRRHADSIALVIAETSFAAKEAMKLIDIEIEETEAVLTMERALEADAPKIHGESNIAAKKTLKKGKDIEEAFKECDIIIENEYESSLQSHMFIEPEAGVAVYENGIVTIYCSTQNVHYDRSEVARATGLHESKVRIVQMTTGGGFGGKLDVSIQCHIALAAMHVGRPVKMVRGRKESTQVSSKRHPMKIKAKTGATKDGKLVALQCTVLADTGAYGSYGPGVITRTTVHMTGPYEIPNVDITANLVFTNNPMAGAMRGFGVPQAAICHEGQMDALAKALNISPFEIRRINGHKVSSTTGTGQVLTESVGLIDTINQAESESKKILPQNKKGIGMACMWYGIGNTALPNPAAAFVEVLPDSSVNLMVGCADIGQGSSTILSQIVAEELGLPYESITVTSADTGVTPEGGATSASRQTFISGNAAKNAATAAKDILADVAKDLLQVAKEKIVFKNGIIYEDGNKENSVPYKTLMAEMKKMGRLAIGAGSYNPKTTALSADTMQGVPYEVYSYSTTAVEVEVSEETGRIYLKKVVSAHDVGTAINRQMVDAQIEGGVVMGQSFALFEKMETSNGKISNPMFSKYILPTSMDTPEIYPIIVESEGTAGPFGAKGVGEPALIAVIPAIAAAVEDAIGVRINKFPLTPPDVMQAIEKRDAT